MDSHTIAKIAKFTSKHTFGYVRVSLSWAAKTTYPISIVALSRHVDCSVSDKDASKAKAWKPSENF